MKKNAGWIIGALLLGLWLFSRRRGEWETQGTAGTLRLQLLDESGNVVATQGARQGARMGALTWNPFDPASTGPGTTEGRSYTVRAIVTNRSTQGGLPVNVTFTVLHTVTVGGVSRLSKTQDITFAIGPVGTFLPANADGAFALLVGDAGRAGAITVVVQAPTGAEVARATETFTIGSAAPTYSATISITAISSAEDYLAQIAAATTRAELDAIWTAAQAAVTRGEITSVQLVTIFGAYLARVTGIGGALTSPAGLTGAQLESWYLAAYALTPMTDAERNILRYGGTFRTVVVTGFETDYGTNRLTYAQYTDVYSVYTSTVTTGNRPRDFTAVLAGR